MGIYVGLHRQNLQQPRQAENVSERELPSQNRLIDAINLSYAGSGHGGNDHGKGFYMGLHVAQNYLAAFTGGRPSEKIFYTVEFSNNNPITPDLSDHTKNFLIAGKPITPEIVERIARAITEMSNSSTQRLRDEFDWIKEARTFRERYAPENLTDNNTIENMVRDLQSQYGTPDEKNHEKAYATKIFEHANIHGIVSGSVVMLVSCAEQYRPVPFAYEGQYTDIGDLLCEKGWDGVALSKDDDVALRKMIAETLIAISNGEKNIFLRLRSLRRAMEDVMPEMPEALRAQLDKAELQAAELSGLGPDDVINHHIASIYVANRPARNAGEHLQGYKERMQAWAQETVPEISEDRLAAFNEELHAEMLRAHWGNLEGDFRRREKIVLSDYGYLNDNQGSALARRVCVDNPIPIGALSAQFGNVRGQVKAVEARFASLRSQPT